MEAAENCLDLFDRWRMKLTDLFISSRQRDLEKELAETGTRLTLQSKRIGQFRRRYEELDKRYAALEGQVGGLRTRLYTETQRADALKRAVEALCSSATAVGDLKRIYEAVLPALDNCGLQLFYAAQEITGFRLYEQFPYEDSCGCFEMADGFTLMRYLEADEFGAVEWETVPGTACKKARLKALDKSTPAYKEYERQLYPKVLERLGLQIGPSTIEQAANISTYETAVLMRCGARHR